MEDAIISFETAKLAKEKGLEGELSVNWVYCIGFNSIMEERELSFSPRTSVKGQFHLALAPTQSLLQKWFRENYKILVCVSWTENDQFLYEINHNQRGLSGFKTYELALEAGLKEVLLSIK